MVPTAIRRASAIITFTGNTASSLGGIPFFISLLSAEPELLGWNVRKDLVPEYVPATTLLHTLTGTGTQSFLTLFLPLKPNTPNPVVRVESQTPGSAMVILADGRQLNIVAKLGATSGITITETMPKGAPGRQTKVLHRS